MSVNKQLSGLFSALATFALLVFISFKCGAFEMTAKEIVAFIFGGVREIANSKTTFLMMFPVIITAVILELPCTIVAAVLQAKILGKSGKHAIADMFENMGEGNHFFTFFVMVLLEELSARWFFLGLLPNIKFLSGTVAFYVLFLVGNGIWALVHLNNFKEQKDHSALRVLPQFVAGVFFTYIFVKYGLLASILAHFASNAILFATHKVQRTGLIDALLVVYGAICAAIAYALMDKPLADILPWFLDDPAFRLQGWEFWDYIKVSVFLSSCFSVLFGLLLYDRDGTGESSDQEVGLLSYIIVIPATIGLLYGAYALLGLVIANVPYRVLILAILFTFLRRGTSGSTVARAFWSGLPDAYISICILQALGFWAALVWIAIEIAIGMPRFLLAKLND